MGIIKTFCSILIMTGKAVVFRQVSPLCGTILLSWHVYSWQDGIEVFALEAFQNCVNCWGASVFKMAIKRILANSRASRPKRWHRCTLYIHFGIMENLLFVLSYRSFSYEYDDSIILCPNFPTGCGSWRLTSPVMLHSSIRLAARALGRAINELCC